MKPAPKYKPVIAATKFVSSGVITKPLNDFHIVFLCSNCFISSGNLSLYLKKLGVFTNENPLLIFPDKSSIKLNYIKSARKLWESKV